MIMLSFPEWFKQINPFFGNCFHRLGFSTSLVSGTEHITQVDVDSLYSIYNYIIQNNREHKSTYLSVNGFPHGHPKGNRVNVLFFKLFHDTDMDTAKYKTIYRQYKADKATIDQVIAVRNEDLIPSLDTTKWLISKLQEEGRNIHTYLSGWKGAHVYCNFEPTFWMNDVGATILRSYIDAVGKEINIDEQNKDPSMLS